MKRIRHAPPYLVAALAILLLGGTAWAQSAGRIAGVVKDSSGGLVQSATVTATNQADGKAQTATTADDGSFAIENLAPGAYTVTAELGGFRKAVHKDVVVSGGGTASAAFTLEAGRMEEVTVTGTRFQGRTATETAAPVDIIDSLAIRSTGATETGKILQMVEPSFNFSTTTISDGTDIVRPATLRGLGPDQVLLLLNGKRRHQQSLLNVQQTIARGSAGYDINTIPASALDRVEVLRDGASAQYGSDAIAGVINVMLRGRTRATDITVEGGQFYAENPTIPLDASPSNGGGHGGGFVGSINTGLDVGTRGFVNLTGEYRDRGETNRAGADSLRVDPARVVQRIGDPAAKDESFFLNSELPAGDGTFYAFGGYSHRKGNSSGFFRSAGDGRTVPQFYPNGFLPTIITEPTDLSATLGYRANLGSGGWRYDLTGGWGQSRFQFREENTVNVSYFYEPRDRNNPTGPRFNESAQAADTGRLGYDQLFLSGDLAGSVAWGVGSGPLNLATGVEWRQEGYEIKAGEEVSYEYGRNNDRSVVILDQTGGIAAPGTQGFPGWSPSEAVDESRNTFAVYADAESLLSSRFLLGLAARFENYSDFGSTLNGKLSARFNASDKFSLRGTVSTGFRAPSVQQAFYSQRSTNLNSEGVLTDTLTARQDSTITRAFGIPALKEETSVNFSAGFVARPTSAFRLTVDVFRIDIDDRIVLSSYITPESSGCGPCPIADLLAPQDIGQIQFFTNAVDTSTKGIDIVGLYDIHFGGDAILSLEAALNFNKTEVTDLRSPSTIVPAAVLFDATQVTLYEEGQPRQHHLLSATYRRGGWSGNMRLNYFGEVAGEGFTPGFKQVWGGKALVDAALTVPLKKDKISLTVGANNLFDVYPDNWDPDKAFPFPQLGFTYGWETLPFGINGGYYYARLNVHLNH